MLYIDQPVSTGLSYTKAVKSTLDLMFLGSPVTETGITSLASYNGSVPPQNETLLYGTFSEQSPMKTPNTTLSAAKTLWHFLQAWTESDFIETQNKKLSIWGNSYGGFWVPVTAAYTVQQNELIAKGALNATHIDLDAVGTWTDGQSRLFGSQIADLICRLDQWLH